MGNLGHRWLEYAGLSQAETPEKILALTALELRSASEPLSDRYPEIWEGNMSGNTEAIRELRRALLQHGPCAEFMLVLIGVDTRLLNTFLYKEGLACNVS